MRDVMEEDLGIPVSFAVRRNCSNTFVVEDVSYMYYTYRIGSVV